MNRDQQFLKMVNGKPGITSKELCTGLGIDYTELNQLAVPWLASGLVERRKRKKQSNRWYPSVKEQ